MLLGPLMEDCSCMRWLMLCSLAALLGTAFSQPIPCMLPTRERIADLVQAAARDDAGEETLTTNLINFHYTCQALDDRVDFFRSLSIAVTYTSSETSNTAVSHQLQLDCNTGTGNFDRATSRPFETFRNETLVFSIQTRRDCRECSANTAIGFDVDANCAREYQATKQPHPCGIIIFPTQPA